MAGAGIASRGRSGHRDVLLLGAPRAFASARVIPLVRLVVDVAADGTRIAASGTAHPAAVVILDAHGARARGPGGEVLELGALAAEAVGLQPLLDAWSPAHTAPGPPAEAES